MGEYLKLPMLFPEKHIISKTSLLFSPLINETFVESECMLPYTMSSVIITMIMIISSY